jgi:hypothetical protein
MFLQGIKADARFNPQLLAVKANIVINDEINGDLFGAINSLKDMMCQVTGMSTGRLEQHQVGAVQGQPFQGGN